MTGNNDYPIWARLFDTYMSNLEEQIPDKKEREMKTLHLIKENYPRHLSNVERYCVLSEQSNHPSLYPGMKD